MFDFYFPPQQIPFIRRAYEGLPEAEIEGIERNFLSYLDIALRIFELSDTNDQEV